jgi:hypothetical protein
MLGSLEDADDAIQDALLRAWRGLARFEGRSSLRTWLYTIGVDRAVPGGRDAGGVRCAVPSAGPRERPARGRLYLWDSERRGFEAGVIDVLTLRGERIAEVTAFIGAERFPRFGLPGRLPA